MWSEIPFSFFIECDISTGDFLPNIRIVKLTSFRVHIVTNEDVLMDFVIQLTSMLVRNVHMSYVSEDS